MASREARRVLARRSARQPGERCQGANASPATGTIRLAPSNQWREAPPTGGVSVFRPGTAARTLPPGRESWPHRFAAGLGVVGLDALEPVIVAALVTAEPLLLIGPHGTGKSYLLARLAEALGLRWRHYNASLLDFDDLVG
jgi:hypothetical protein